MKNTVLKTLLFSMIASTLVISCTQGVAYKRDFNASPSVYTKTEEVASFPHTLVGKDKFEHKEPNPVKLTKEEPVSTFSIDVDTASYSFVRRAINEGHLPPKDAVRIEELINYFDYDYEAPKSKENPFKPTVAVYPSPWNKNNKLLHIGIKGHEVEKLKRPKANLVFLVDVSGSMSSPDKLPLLKKSLRLMVDELNPDDKVSIAVYAGSAGVVLEPTEALNKNKIFRSLDNLQAGGSTAGGWE